MLPFLLWDIVYNTKNVLFGNNVEWKDVLFDFFTGGAAAPLYYILVLFQLTLLTPLIVKKENEGKVTWLYAITPLYISIVYAWTILMGEPPRLYGTIFPAWLLFYLVGIDCRIGKLNRYVQKCNYLWLGFAIGIEMLEAFAWSSSRFSITLASSQLKFSSCLYSIVIILLLKKKEKIIGLDTLLSKIGDCSFGIFFLHCMVLWVVKKLLSVAGIGQCGVIFWIYSFLGSAIISFIIIKLAREKIGDVRKLRWIGFD